MEQRKVTVEPLIDAGDGAILAYFTKGNVTDDVFRDALSREKPDSDGLLEAPVLHAWWRWVPSQPGDDDASYQYDAQPHARGAFEVTYVSLYQEAS